MPNLSYSVLSERGLRPKNDDATFVNRIGKYSAFIIADGRSDSAHTDHINTVALKALTDAVKNREGPPRAVIEAGVRAADAKVKDLVRKYKDQEMHATKLIACLIDDQMRCTAIDTGEGNCHVITETTIRNVQDAARSGKPPGNSAVPQVPKTPELTDMISHVLGAPHRLKKEDFTQFQLRDEFLLLSSDGLTDHLGEEKIADIVRTRGEGSLEAATEALVQEALKAGSESTITVILVRRSMSQARR